MIKDDEKQFLKERKLMVENQIKGRGIHSDNVLQAMVAVPRHRFISKNQEKRAYLDGPLPIGLEQTISQPFMVAYMSEGLDIKMNHKVLEIGTGSGYQTAILSLLTTQIYTVEIIKELSSKACILLDNLGYKNINFKVDDGAFGWREEAPFDRIIVTAAPKKIPKILIDQLALGGKMIIPIGENYQNLFLFEKKMNGKMTQRLLMPVIFVPMMGDLYKEVG